VEGACVSLVHVRVMAYGRRVSSGRSIATHMHLLGRRMEVVVHSAQAHHVLWTLQLDRGGLLQVFYPSRSRCDYHTKHTTPARIPRCDRISLALALREPCGHETWPS
jgi:hypothetical protein